MACAADGDGIDRVTAGTRECSRPRLPGAVDAIFETRQLLGANGAAGVEFAGGNSDLRAEAEFTAIGELRRNKKQHKHRNDNAKKKSGGTFVFRLDRIGVMRAVALNV